MTEVAKKASHFALLPDKHYFTIGEVSEWCGIEQHVLRYWEQVFRQLKPVRRGKRRFYTKKDLYIVKKIYTLLKLDGYTIEGAKRKINDDEYQHSFKVHYDNRILDEVIGELQDILKSME
ncbi:MAG: MerR family transcriptional regulator [Chromatiales bacterium]|nr:MerR family transcriptional regulator [Chromatiales bacterium]